MLFRSPSGTDPSRDSITPLTPLRLIITTSSRWTSEEPKDGGQVLPRGTQPPQSKVTRPNLPGRLKPLLAQPNSRGSAGIAIPQDTLERNVESYKGKRQLLQAGKGRHKRIGSRLTMGPAATGPILSTVLSKALLPYLRKNKMNWRQGSNRTRILSKPD